MRSSLVAVCLFSLSWGCSSSPNERTNGEALYREPQADGNTFACATCHALQEPASDGFIRPGHPIGDATNRPSYKNGRVATMLEAVNTCRVEWMTATPWTEDDPSYKALHAYLESQAPAGAAGAVAIDIVAPPADTSGGDADRGRDLFNHRCIVCHGEDAVGTDRAPGLAGVELDPPYIARRVRTSGVADSPTYDGLTGGRMPFWGGDRLSDAELIDIIAFIGTKSAPIPDAGPEPDAGVSEDAGTEPELDAAPSGCDSTSPRIGQVADFVTRFHGVTGTATIIDDCTIDIAGFRYDGSGIDVRIYGAPSGDYRNGFSMTDDLLRPGGYQGETIRATVPGGHTIDEVDGISVWCVAVGVSFGDLIFPDRQ